MSAQHDTHAGTRGKALPRPDLDTIRRFLAQVCVQGIDGGLDRCWLWTGCTRSDDHARATPYGQFRIRAPETGEWTTRHAHRVSYAIFNAMGLPAGPDVDHTCGNHRCVNPAHLRLLTRGDNVTAANVQRGGADDAAPF